MTAAQAVPGSRPGIIYRHLALATALVIVFDRLLYSAPLGISLTLAFAVLATAAVLANRSRNTTQSISPSLFLLPVAALLPGVEHAGVLSVLFATLGVAIFALILSGRLTGEPVQRVSTVAELLLTGPFRLLPDLLRLRRAAARSKRSADRHDWSVWLMPAALGAVFVGLLAAANPLIEDWLSRIDVGRGLSELDMSRIGFWLTAAMLAWPFVHVRAKPFMTSRLHATQAKPDQPTEKPDRIFAPAAILRGLIVFNALFAVQTVLDIVYLWGGASLPDGMTYAQYAQRGAYPLIVTALLAAAFVLAAMRPGSRSERVPAIRVLVYLWTGQNILLVISAMLRLNLYVAVYSLTMLRVAAFLWMLLVAAGLVLIVARIALDRSNGWLVSLNAAALATLLYVCSFVNFPHVIASYNVAHCREITGTGNDLDVDYLLKLGPHVIPALDPFLAARPDALYRRQPAHTVPVRVYRYNGLLQLHRRKMSDWRGWTFRDWRLMRDLQGRSDLPLKRDGDTSRPPPPGWVLDELGLPPDPQRPDLRPGQ